MAKNRRRAHSYEPEYTHKKSETKIKQRKMVFNKYQHVTAAACPPFPLHHGCRRRFRRRLRSHLYTHTAIPSDRILSVGREFVATCTTKSFSLICTFFLCLYQKITIIMIKIIIIDEISHENEQW